MVNNWNIEKLAEENVKDEGDFLPVDKYQIDTIILGVLPGMPKLPKKESLLFFLQYLKEEVSDEIDFLNADMHKNLLQIDTMTLIGILKHSQSSQNTKVTLSLQYIKKEVRKGMHF